jgi:hypothetical protein
LLFGCRNPCHTLCSTGTDEADNHFDAVIGALEDLIMEADFNSLQSGFFRKVRDFYLLSQLQSTTLCQHCSVFEDSEENKLEYTSLFQSCVCISSIIIALFHSGA